jgi:hypothetical protein
MNKQFYLNSGCLLVSSASTSGDPVFHVTVMSEEAAAAAAAAALAAALPPVVAAVAVKLPDFWLEDPEMWFDQAEAQFDLSHITASRTKYQHVLVKLPPVLLKNVRDVVRGIAASQTPYEDLKERLTEAFRPSKWRQASAIIHHAAVGDGRPSHLLDAMVALLPEGEAQGAIFQCLFLEKLPTDIRDHLMAGKFETPRLMAAHADQLWDGRQGLQQQSVSAVRHASPARQQVAEQRGRRDDNHRRFPSSGRRGRTATPRPPAADGLCFYHGNFAEKAHRCQAPCSWAGNAPAAGGN